MSQFYLNSNQNPQQAATAFNTLRQQTLTNIGNVLNPTQMQQWQQMIGQPYNFQPIPSTPQTPQTSPK